MGYLHCRKIFGVKITIFAVHYCKVVFFSYYYSRSQLNVQLIVRGVTRGFLIISVCTRWKLWPCPQLWETLPTFASGLAQKYVSVMVVCTACGWLTQTDHWLVIILSKRFLATGLLHVDHGNESGLTKGITNWLARYSSHLHWLLVGLSSDKGNKGFQITTV